MDRRELITILKEPAYKVMRELKIPSSIIMAISIAILEQEDIIHIAEDLVLGNNPMAIEPDYSYDGETILNEITKKVYRVYGSLEEGLANYITSNKDIFENMKGILQYDYAFKKNETYTREEKDYLISIIEEFELYSLDKQASDIFFSSKSENSLIELENTDHINIVDEIKESMGIIENKKEETAKPIHIVKKKKRVELKPIKTKKISDNLESKTIMAGTRIYLLGANLYESAVSNVPVRSITGEFFICSGVCENNKYAIAKTLNMNNYIMGYVNRRQIILK